MKVLIADKLAPIVRKYLEKNNCICVENSNLQDQSLVEALQQEKPDILVVRSTKVNKDHINNCPSLSLIIRAGAGVNTIDMTTASSKGVFVANCPGRNAIAVAELVFGHITNWSRNISNNIQNFHAGIWNKKAYSASNGLYGATIAVLGLGAIGMEVISRAQAFGMQVQGWSRSLTPEKAEELGIIYCATPKEAVLGAEMVTVHLPYTASTKHFINQEILDAMLPKSLLINTSRAELVDEQALLSAIETKQIFAGLDVFEGEPSGGYQENFTSVLQHNPHVYVTHHIGASTEQATVSVAQAVIDIIDSWKNQGIVPNCVNIKTKNPLNSCLSIRHADKVGVLANILLTLKSHGHNVQEMENVVFQGGTAACARIFIMGVPTAELLEELQQVPDIFACSLSTTQST